MSFKDIINEYLRDLGVSSKDLADVSLISLSVISRYRSGDRTPLENSEQIKRLAFAIVDIAKIKGKAGYQYEEILQNLNTTVRKNSDFNYEIFSNNLNTLINALEINTNEMAKYMVFDASHISRIRYGKAKPSNPKDFANKVCQFVIFKCKSLEDRKNLGLVIGCDKKVSSENELLDLVYKWLVSSSKKAPDQIGKFLNDLDNFNLEKYIKAIKFDELKVPSIPFYKGKTKRYYGIEEMKQGELNFFKATVLGKATEDIFMCSDMPMEDMAEDLDFGKKWMFAIAMCLKKNLHLNIIHNLDRPFNEMMLGLESWIPIYMTGLVSPYYLKEVKNSVYQHLNYVSGAVALSGECIKGAHDKGMYYLTTNKNEVLYYKEKAKLLLGKANHLMDIYKEENSQEFNLFLEKDKYKESDRKRFLSSLPLFTINEKLLLKILKRNGISLADIEKIREYKQRETEYIEEILLHNKMVDNIYDVREIEFKKEGVTLNLNNWFYDKNINYTYEEYKEHLEDTIKYANSNINYEIVKASYRTFKNITVTILKDDYVIISKSANPVIHFVIRHPKLTMAIRNFEPMVKEELWN